MALDIKEKIEELVGKLKSDKKLLAKFQKDPVKTIEGLIGINLPDEQLKGVADAVKAKLSLDKLGDLGDKLGGILGKK